uniref:Scr1 family TA system antitoxin-like transcriptional regulator n=1 Tax=Actinacidiphila oryziradicis TaxID=2571141 RepID=UPI0038992EE2
MNGGFTLIDFPDPNDPETVYLDSPAGNLYVKKSHGTRRFGQTFSRLCMTALDVEESGQFLQAVLKET